MWGVVEITNNDVHEIHVVPVNENKEIKESHSLDCFCQCSPRVEVKYTALIVIHNEEN